MPAKKKTPPAPAEEAIVPPAPLEPVAPVAPQPVPVPPTPVVPPPAAAPVPPQPMAPGDERTWAMLAHLSVLLNLVTGFFGPIAAGIIYFVCKERSRLVAYHALQSAIFQAIWWYGGGVLATAAGIIAGVFAWTIVIPICCGLFAILFMFLPVGALIYGVVGAVQVSQGQDFKYWLIGDWVRGTLTG
jgi:uncharacterized Tic20 family protein